MFVFSIISFAFLPQWLIDAVGQIFPREDNIPLVLVSIIAGGILGFGFGFYYCKYREKEKAFRMFTELSEIENRVLDYIKAHNYKIAVSECMTELGLSYAEVENALKSLSEKGLLARKT